MYDNEGVVTLGGALSDGLNNMMQVFMVYLCALLDTGPLVMCLICRVLEMIRELLVGG